MDIRFLAPGWLLLLLLVPLLWFWPARLRDWRHGALRSLLLVALATGLARPLLFRADGAEYHVLVVDRSASVPAAARTAADTALDRILAELPARAVPALVVVGEASPVPTGRLRAAVGVQGVDSASSLAAALQAAHGLIPEGARGAVTVLTDGAATDRRWGPVTQAFAARGIPVHPVLLRPEPGTVFPTALHADGELRVGQTARLVCDVVGEAAAVGARLLGPDGELDRVQDVAVQGRGALFFEFEPKAGGFLPLRVELDAGPAVRAGTDAVARTFAVQDPLRVLYLGERVTGSAGALRDLLGPGFELADGVALAGDDVGAVLAAHDVVFVDDRPSAGLPQPFQDGLLAAVAENGMGLLFAGGKAAFGPGGYHGTPVAQALPVESVQKEEKRDPSTTLVLIIDTSGSMGGMRVTLAKEVARLAMRRLLPHDKVGIVEFYGAKRWAAPIQPASNQIELQRALNRLDSGGGTVILPAIEEAFYGLQNVETRYKHVLILTDGGVETGAFEPLLRKMASKGINVSTVLVGPEAHSEFLVTLANWGKGRFYNVPDRFNLPEIILKQPASAQLPAYRPGQHAVRAHGAGGWWGETDPRAVPPLAGYVETSSRPGAQTLLETEQGAHPVLASWRYGLGRVTAMATEPTGPGTAPWRDWSGYGPWLARVLTRTARDNRSSFTFAVERQDHLLTVTAVRLDHGSALPAARLLGEDGGSPRELAFRERAPGRFAASLVWPPAADARLLCGDAGRPADQRWRLCSTARADVAPERQVDPEAGLDLGLLAAATGGAFLDVTTAAAAELRAGGGNAAVTLLDLAPWCLLLALLLFLGDLLHRRWPAREARA